MGFLTIVSGAVNQNNKTLWTPAQLPGLRMWRDASNRNTLFSSDVGGTLPTADQGVGRIVDLMGFSNATQSNVTFQPIRKVGIQNGLDMLRFDGIDDLMMGPNVFSDTDVWSIFGVTSGPLHSRGRDGSGNGWSISQSTSGVSVVTSSPVAGYSASVPADGSSGVLVIGGIYSSPNLRFFRSGIEGTTVSTGTGMRSSTIGNVIGELNSTFTPGDYGEEVATATVISAEDIDRLMGYFSHKWGLTSKLPTNHPYKNSPPYVENNRITASGDTRITANNDIRIISE